MSDSRIHLFISPILLMFSVFIYGQKHEFGLFGGGAYYIGDINPYKHFYDPRYALGGIYRYHFDNHWTMRLNVYHGRVESSDSVIKFNHERNLSFRSNITEVSLGMEVNFFPFRTGSKRFRASPFIFAGLGYFIFNPRAHYEGEWHALQPLGTEGQGSISYPDRKPYTLSSLCLPFGAGAKFSIGTGVCVGFEWGLRKTNTDYLDDISTTYADPYILSVENSQLSAILSDRTKYSQEPFSNTGRQRGDSSTQDWYSFFGVTISFKINTIKEPCHGIFHKTINVRGVESYRY